VGVEEKRSQPILCVSRRGAADLRVWPVSYYALPVVVTDARGVPSGGIVIVANLQRFDGFWGWMKGSGKGCGVECRERVP